MVEQGDPKDAFFSELKALLGKYHATISADGGYDWCDLLVEFDRGDRAEEYTLKEHYIDEGNQVEIKEKHEYKYKKKL